MDGLKSHQAAHDAIEDRQTNRHPMINPDELSTPIGIVSTEDGVIVYANEAFRQIIKSTKVGEPIKGFLHTPEMRNSISKKLERSSRYVKLLERPTISLRFTITKGLFLEAEHYFVSIEQIDLPEQTSQKSFLDREDFVKQLSMLTNLSNDDECSVCTIDIDRFKVVNEKYGYEAGNYILNELVQVIKQYIPENNIIGRLGSNEFGIILKGESIEDSVQLCEVIREKIKDYDFNFNQEIIEITLSIGVISISDAPLTLEEILAAANLALRSAQENGRDCVHSSATQDTMMAYHSGKMHYAMVIEDALQNDKFELFAQPIVSLADENKHYSYEILLRIFDHKQNEFVSSQELISAAESLEVTTRIDQWVCEKVFKDIFEKANNGIKIPSISINLSGHSIVSIAFERFLLELTDKYNVPTSCICFEITESVAVKSITRAQNFIHNLKAVGYKFSLDDFGVGYCSFNYLNQLDVDHVKIDGSFVSAMLDDATQFATVQAITSVARTMNIKTIAEFVEKPEIIKALKVIGVDCGQGYIFGKPSPIKDIYKNII
ncbi:MAG: EAL domain-containing protein [Gammaproteobacteria bacterium]